MDNVKDLNPNSKTPKLIILGVVILVVAGLALLYLHEHGTFLSKGTSASEPYNFTYSKLDSYTLLGQAPGNGISFEKPVEITGPDGQSHFNVRLTSNMFFQALKSKQPMAAQVGTVMVQSYANQNLPTGDSLKSIKADAKKPDSPTAKSFQELLTNFVAGRLTNYSVSVGSIRPLTTANLPDNAWGAGYTASPKAQQSPDLYPAQQGEAVLLYGKNTYYYFAIGVVDYNWTAKANQPIWTEVFNSLKVDQ